MNAAQRPDLGENRDQRDTSTWRRVGFARTDRTARHRAARGARPAAGGAVHRVLAPARRRPRAPRSASVSTRASFARSTRRWPTTPGAASRRRPPPSGCSTTSTSFVAALRDIHHDLPPSFFRRLPRIAADEFAGLPRIYAMALELIRCSAGRLDAQRLHRFVTAFQSITPLTMGELWAWPSALKLALVEHLRDASRHPRDEPRASPRRGSAGRRARDAGADARDAGRPRCIRPSSSACCSGRANTRRAAAAAARARRGAGRRAARRSRMRFARRRGIRRPSRRSWRT